MERASGSAKEMDHTQDVFIFTIYVCLMYISIHYLSQQCHLETIKFSRCECGIIEVCLVMEVTCPPQTHPHRRGRKTFFPLPEGSQTEIFSSSSLSQYFFEKSSGAGTNILLDLVRLCCCRRLFILFVGGSTSS